MAIPIDTNLRLQNDSQARGDGWWEWSVWIDGPIEDIQRVESVTYRLHPTFAHPVRQVRDPATRFRLRAEGWGEFAIVADVHFQDKRTTRLERWLDLRDEKGHPQTSSQLTVARAPTAFVSHSVADNPLVRTLGEKLAQHGVQISTEQSIASGRDFQAELRTMLKRADIVLPVFSDPPSEFVETEAKIARAAGRMVLPIVIGNATLPPSLSDLVRFELREVTNVEALADNIVARVKDLILPEESAGGSSHFSGREAGSLPPGAD